MAAFVGEAQAQSFPTQPLRGAPGATPAAVGEAPPGGETVELPLKELADLVGTAGELSNVKAERDALKALVRTKEAIIADLRELKALAEEKAQRKDERAKLAEEDAAFYKARLAATLSEANKEIRRSHTITGAALGGVAGTVAASSVAGGALIGAATGTAVLPVIGTALGAGIGALVGWWTAPEIVVPVPPTPKPPASDQRP